MSRLECQGRISLHEPRQHLELRRLQRTGLATGRILQQHRARPHRPYRPQLSFRRGALAAPGKPARTPVRAGSFGPRSYASEPDHHVCVWDASTRTNLRRLGDALLRPVGLSSEVHFGHGDFHAQSIVSHHNRLLDFQRHRRRSGRAAELPGLQSRLRQRTLIGRRRGMIALNHFRTSRRLSFGLNDGLKKLT